MLTTLNLSQEQLQVISDGLMQVPYGKAAPVISEINKQIQDQFGESADARDMPSGAVTKSDQFSDS